MAKIPAPFNHRKNLVNLVILSDILTFVATICWMEFSQSVLTQTNVYTISPLSLFVHHGDSQYTYFWVFLFNFSTYIAVLMLSLCIYAVHQTSFNPSDFLFLFLTVITFVAISISPIIAFISFFKLSFLIIIAMSQSTINIVPAIFSPHILFPTNAEFYSPTADTFHRELFRFIHENDEIKEENLEKNPMKSLRTKTNNKSNDEYAVRVGIANKILAAHYTKSFWLPLHERGLVHSLEAMSYTECTGHSIRTMRGCTVQNVILNLKHAVGSWKRYNQHTDYWTFTADTVLDVQYLMMLFVFIPIQTLFALYGLVYPYFIVYQIIMDLHNMQHGTVSNEIMRVLLGSGLETMEEILVRFIEDWCCIMFILSVIGHFVSINFILYKIWRLRAVFGMCLDVMIVTDTAPLDHKLIRKMSRVRLAMECRKVSEKVLGKLLGRYHLDGMILDFVGDFQEEE